MSAWKRLCYLYFLPWVTAFLASFGIGWGLFPPDEANAGPVALVIMFAAVTPLVLTALLGQTTPQTRAIVLLGGSLVKIVAICLMVLAVRRAQWPFADKNSFLIWLFVSYLLTSSLGWIVVAARGPSGGDSGGTVPR